MKRAGSVGVVGGGFTAVGRQDDAAVVHVPDDHPSIQAAVTAADPGSLVLVAPGRYEEAVTVSTAELTIRGTDRNEVVLDGGFELTNGVDVEADRVAVENLTIRHYRANAVYWDGVAGFRGSHLTAYNNGNYGIYAYESQDGRFEHSYASGHPDAGFYVGHGHPFHTVVTDVTAENNAWGYSGTSAGGDLTVRDSVWRDNRVGIVPNTLSPNDPPQRDARIVGNEVRANNNRDAPVKQETHPGLGTGILVWGGNENLLADNEVADHEHFGVALAEHVVVSSRNVVRNNDVSDSGLADVAVGVPSDADNRFEANEYATSLPPDLDGPHAGSDRASELFAEQSEQAASGDVPGGDWQDAPEPDDRPSMADPQRTPLPVDKSHGYSGP